VKQYYFFGCRHPDKDFLYKDELQAHHAQGHITDLILAFSRYEDHKVYVQHKMMEGDMPNRIWNILCNGGHFYVCGDAAGMARDVHETLLNIIETQGKKTKAEAAHYIEELQQANRHQSDVWS